MSLLSYDDSMNDELRVRCDEDLKPRMRRVCKLMRTKMSMEARKLLYAYVEEKERMLGLGPIEAEAIRPLRGPKKRKSRK